MARQIFHTPFGRSAAAYTPITALSAKGSVGSSNGMKLAMRVTVSGRSGAHDRIDVGDVGDGDFYEAARVHLDGACCGV